MIPNSIPQQFIRTAFALAVTVVLVACGKPEETAQPAASTQQATQQPSQQATLSAPDCDRLADPKPAEESAAARATAVSQGMAARQACKRAAQNASAPNQANADLARIREIKENEESERVQRKVTEAQWKEGLRRGANAPLRELKY